MTIASCCLLVTLELDREVASGLEAEVGRATAQGLSEAITDYLGDGP